MGDQEAVLADALHGKLNRELKDLLRARGQALSGKKDMLVGRLIKYARTTGTVEEMLDELQGGSRETYDSYGGYGGDAHLQQQPLHAAHHQQQQQQQQQQSLGHGNGSFGYPNLLGDFDYGQVNGAPGAAYDGMGYGAGGTGALDPKDDLFVRGERVLQEIAEKDPFHEVSKVLYGCSLLTPGFFSNVHVDMVPYPGTFDRLDRNAQHQRVLVFCTNLDAAGTPVHQWPRAIEIKVNQKAVPVTQQCLDGRHINKALLERPCDIKSQLSYRSNNSIRFSIPIVEASSKEPPGRWAAAVVLCREISTAELVQQMAVRPLDHCQEIIEAVFGDGEVICSEMLCNLRDPVSMLRIKIPAKGALCKHVQCFDAETFFNYQRKAKNAKWKCVICSRQLAGPRDVVVDSWCRGVLEATADRPEVDQVEYFMDGTWKVREPEASGSLSDDGSGQRPEQAAAAASANPAAPEDGGGPQVGSKRTCTEAGLEGPVGAGGAISRQASACISLLSDDEED